MSLAGLLFYNAGELRHALEQQASGLSKEIERVPEEHLLTADSDEWAHALAARWAVVTPVLLESDMWQDKPEEVGVDVSHDFMRAQPMDGGPAITPGYRVVVHIPFEGDAHVFNLKASTYGLNPPRADIGQSELTDIVEYPADSPADIGAHARKLAADVNKYLEWSRADIDQFNRGLEQQALQAIETRKARVVANHEHIQRTGLPVGPPQQEAPQTYIADAIVRRPAPTLPQTKSEPMTLEPVLLDDVFEHILGVIRSQAEAMERSPGTYRGMPEEDRRQVILAALHGHYRGKTTGEAFNVEGKTDLLVKHEGQNLFIAECKIWDGVQTFTDAVSQLFTYTAWRDTKLAIVMFVSPRDLTSVIERAGDGLAEHTQFVEWKNAASETELRAAMHWPGDERRLADLNVFFVHVPSE